MTILDIDGTVYQIARYAEPVPSRIAWYNLPAHVRAAIARRKFTFGRKCE